MSEPSLLITRLEELSLNAWPSPHRVILDGWVLQFTGGFTGRANSIHPIYAGVGDVRERICACEQRYADAGLPPMFKVTAASAPHGLEEALLEAGYHPAPGAHVQTTTLSPELKSLPDAYQTWSGADDAWVSAYGSFRDLPDQHYAALRSILAAIALPTYYAAIHDDRGKVAAVGLAVREGEWAGLFDIIVRPDARRRGFGRRIVESLLGWASRTGARRAYLQVANGNTTAIELYEKLGFGTAYSYRYFTKS